MAAPCSCRVVGVDRDVLVREVREEDLGLCTLARERDLVLDLITIDRLLERGEVVGDRGAAGAYLDALDRDVERERRGKPIPPTQRRARRLNDAAPVGV